MNEKLTLQDVTDRLASRTGVTKKVSDDFLREFFSLIIESLAKDGLVKIKGLGTFKLKSVEERKSVNVQTGAEMVIPAHYKVTYTPDKGLSADVNKPYAHLQTYIIDQNGPVAYNAPEGVEDVDDATEEKIDTSVFVNSSDDYEEEFTIGRYLDVESLQNGTDDEIALVEEQESDEEQEEAIRQPLGVSNILSSNAEQPLEEKPIAQLPSEEKETAIDSSTPLEEIEAVPSFTEAQPQEGQLVPSFDESLSLLDTPSVNPGPVVTLVAEEEPTVTEDLEEKKEEQTPLQATESTVQADAPTPLQNPTVEASQEEEELSGSLEDAENQEEIKEEEDMEAEEEVELEENAEVAEEPSQEAGEIEEKEEIKRASRYVGLLIFLLSLALLGLVGYIYQNELKALLLPEEKVEEVQAPDVPKVEEDPDGIYDDRSDANVSGDIIQSNDEGALDEIVESEEAVYSFAPEFVQYMKEEHPNVDITISSIVDEVTLTSGRRLVDLSLRYYGHKYFWVYIYFFNTDVIKDPNRLVPGTLIKVPALSSSLVDKDDQSKLDMAFEIKKLIEK